MEQGEGREGKLFLKKDRKIKCCAIFSNFFNVTRMFSKKILGNVKKLQFFCVREGVK